MKQISTALIPKLDTGFSIKDRDTLIEQSPVWQTELNQLVTLVSYSYQLNSYASENNFWLLVAHSIIGWLLYQKDLHKFH